MKTDSLSIGLQSFLKILLQTGKCAADDKQDITGIDLLILSLILA